MYLNTFRIYVWFEFYERKMQNIGFGFVVFFLLIYYIYTGYVIFLLKGCHLSHIIKLISLLSSLAHNMEVMSGAY